jgi:hypothetical protein
MRRYPRHEGRQRLREPTSQKILIEDIEPLYVNPVLPLLAIALAEDAFADFRTFAEIEKTPPPANGSMYPLQIKEGMLAVPFFQGCNVNGPTGRICTAGTVGDRT